MNLLRPIGLLLLACTAGSAAAQTADSIFFNLYTDSLKKGAWNYINVDGLYGKGRILPVPARQLEWTISGGTRDGNSIWIDWSFSADSVVVETWQRQRPDQPIRTIIWIKKEDLQLQAPLQDSLLQRLNERNRRAPKKKKN
ncbi:MAG TPA: hypothetical protein PKE63_05080 [Lacibacter sp.]|nr:hypothetical protein [Lacibacter sp.]HMO89638.1 hypothetical protein [Lacibacter sp.]HMP86628.1 hypothetical protein [Lacibacter sp.]